MAMGTATLLGTKVTMGMDITDPDTLDTMATVTMVRGTTVHIREADTGSGAVMVIGDKKPYWKGSRKLKNVKGGSG
jgi:hypothetical protein